MPFENQIDLIRNEIADAVRGGAANLKVHAVAQVDRIAHRLDGIALGIDRLDTTEEHRIIQANVQLDGAGAGTARVDMPRQGYEWVIERVTCAAQNNAVIQLFRGETTNLANCMMSETEVGPVLAKDVNKIYVGDNTPITVRVSGGPVSTQVQIGMQVVEIPKRGVTV